MPQPTTEPLRLRAQKALMSRLAQISPEQDYFFDLRPETVGGKTIQHTFRGRFWFGDSDPLPLVSLLQVPLQPEQDMGKGGSNPSKFGPSDYVIQGWVDDDLENPTDPAEYLLADVERCLAQIRKEGTENGVLGFPSMTELLIGEGVVRPPDEISAKAYFWLPITLVMVRDLSNPYHDE